jgi:2-methylisocitrate lyase-like PEP mutase family enzyme
MPFQEATARLQELINRQGRVTTVLHPPSASLARVMEAAGAEAGFIGTSGVVGSYTGMEDVGTATLNECVQIAGWIARSVRFPVILDGDTGHGGIMAVRRMVEDCIREGIAGVRIDDQPIEGKRGTGTAGMEVQSLDVVLTRYRAAVDRKRELDPNFVVMAQCYVAEASNGGFEESLVRMKAYKEQGEVDWVQLTAPRSVEQVKRAREAVDGPFSIMQGYMDPPLSNEELLALGINLAWLPRPTHDVTYVALYDFIKDFMDRGTGAWVDFQEQHKENPYINGALKIGGVEVAKQRELEEKYLSQDSLEKYERSAGRES